MGDICTLDVDAIVCSSNESLTDRSGVTGEIFRAAGPELDVECKTTEGCKTGEAIITRGCSLPAKYVMRERQKKKKEGPLLHLLLDSLCI